jgi:RpiR family transcriptional regulator, repressor of rpiB and als operon
MHPEPHFDFQGFGRPTRSALEGKATLNQPSSVTPTLAARLRAHLGRLTALEARTIFTLVHQGTSGEDTLLKCAAAAAGVSEALIVKIAKKLGFEGFRQMREALGEHSRLAQMELHEEFCLADGACARLEKVLRAAVRALEEGLARVSPMALDQAADYLHIARQRDFYGEGASGQVARDAAHQFLRIGVRASVFDDSQLMLISAALLRRGDVVVAFSHSGETAAVVEAAHHARQNGAEVIAVTNQSDSPLCRESDVTLCADLDRLPGARENAAARLVQLSVVDALLSAVAQKDYASAEANLSRTAAALSRSCFGAPRRRERMSEPKAHSIAVNPSKVDHLTMRRVQIAA